MRRTFLIAILWTGVAAPASAQAPVAPAAVTPSAAPSTLRLTVDDAVRMALDHNVELSAARLDPQVSDTSVAAAAGAFRPVFSASFLRDNQLQPPATFLVPTATRTDVVTSKAGFNQKLPWFGTSYSVSWDAAHT